MVSIDIEPLGWLDRSLFFSERKNRKPNPLEKGAFLLIFFLFSEERRYMRTPGRGGRRED